jgi:carbamoyltransferase
MGTEMEMLAIGNCLLWKKAQDPGLAQNYKTAFEPD